MTAEQRDRYDQSLINYWDMKNMVDTAVETAVEEKQVEIAENAIMADLDSKTIAKITGLSVDSIEKLRQKFKP